MTIIRIVAVVALAAATSACSTTWVKLGATEQDLLVDRSACESATETEFAADLGGLKGVGSYVDRRGFLERCMIARGWRDKADEQAIVQAPPAAPNANEPLRFPVYSR
jgi:hypothetical protein